MNAPALTETTPAANAYRPTLAEARRRARSAERSGRPLERIYAIRLEEEETPAQPERVVVAPKKPVSRSNRRCPAENQGAFGKGRRID